MNFGAAVLIGFCFYLSSGAVMAATVQDDVSSGRASLLFIVLTAAVLILVGKTAIAIAKNKMEKDIVAMQEESDRDAQKSKSQPKG